MNANGLRTLRPLAVALLLSCVIAGCLEEPPIEERWTNVRIDGQNLDASAPLAMGDSTDVHVTTSVRFEDLVTGYVVAELRASQSLSYEDLQLDAADDPILESEDVERIIAQSVPIGRATRSTVGFPQLIRHFDFDFGIRVPSQVDSTYDPPGGAPQSLFLLVYIADGEEIRLETGRDSLVVDPFVTRDRRVLHKGLPVVLGP
jgi:hypothetical protein